MSNDYSLPRTLILALAVGLSLGALGAPGAAQDGHVSFGVSPGSVHVEGAIAGQTYHKQVTLQNRLDEQVEVETETHGIVGTWTTVQPGGSFAMGQQEDQALSLAIQIPAGTVNGTYTGELRLSAGAGEQPDGSGYAVQHAVTVLLSVHVGGEPSVSIQYILIEANDIELGQHPDVHVEIANTGNVHTPIEIRSLILDANGDEVAQATALTNLDPGQRHKVAMDYDMNTLPLGTYTATAGSTTDPRILEAPFKVVPPGTLGKDLLLRELLHPARAEAGELIKIEAPVMNIGQAPIGQARLIGEVYRDDRLVGTFESGTRSLVIGQELRLNAFFTPEDPGRYILVAVVEYDGFETPARESLLSVEAGGAGSFWLFLLPLFSLILFVFILILFKGRRRKDPASNNNRGQPARVQSQRSTKDPHDPHRHKRGTRRG